MEVLTKISWVQRHNSGVRVYKEAAVVHCNLWPKTGRRLSSQWRQGRCVQTTDE
ncbi:unnamed protein product [Clavelina lepadiformis]|uniref:Uncharacterized protein n=1 Tax=Clavelina lepadiformis TaxID=159417 RepID=A0ABP0H2E1_CLALP